MWGCVSFPVVAAAAAAGAGAGAAAAAAAPSCDDDEKSCAFLRFSSAAAAAATAVGFSRRGGGAGEACGSVCVCGRSGEDRKGGRGRGQQRTTKVARNSQNCGVILAAVAWATPRLHHHEAYCPLSPPRSCCGAGRFPTALLYPTLTLPSPYTPTQPHSPTRHTQSTTQ